MADQARLLLFELPELLQGIFLHALDKEDDMEVLLPSDRAQKLSETAKAIDADVIVTSIQNLSRDTILIELVEQNPRIKIFNVKSDGRQICLYELYPGCRELGQLAPKDFPERIRNLMRVPFRLIEPDDETGEIAVIGKIRKDSGTDTSAEGGTQSVTGRTKRYE